MHPLWGNTAEITTRKPALRAWYALCYESCRDAFSRAPAGTRLELGAAYDLGKAYVPALVTSNLYAGPGLDEIIRAESMPRADGAVAGVCMINVLHHIGAVEAFFMELSRVLVPGGRAMIVDQYPGIPARWIYRFIHHERFDMKAAAWDTGAEKDFTNGAVAWIVFFRDRARFEERYPHLRIHRITPFSPLLYWLCGGLKGWTLLPGNTYRLALWLDKALVAVWPGFASFVQVELVRR